MIMRERLQKNKHVGSRGSQMGPFELPVRED